MMITMQRADVTPLQTPRTSLSTFDIDAVVQTVAGATDGGAGCGPDLAYDPAFLLLEQDLLGKPEVQYGSSITPAVAPDWKVIRPAALELLSRSLDLRVVMALLRADLALQGLVGLTTGLELIRRLLELHWDDVHPMLDPDDGMDPTTRINALAALGEGTSVIRALKEATLLTLPSLGRFTLRLLELAGTDQPAPHGQERMTLASVLAAMVDVDSDSLCRALEVLKRAHANVLAIEATLVQHVGSAQALNLDGLASALKRGCDFLAPLHLARLPVALEQDAAPARHADGDDAAPAGATQHMGAPSGPIANRADVLRALDRLDQYYQQYEPSSPVPLFLGRARQLVPMSFMDIMHNLAPDGLAQLMLIQGAQPEAAPAK